MFNRFENNKIQDGVDADLLLESPVFHKAVTNVLNKYASVEENVLTDNEKEVREITAKIKHYAMMRRAVLDVVEELKQMSRSGKNNSYKRDKKQENK